MSRFDLVMPQPAQLAVLPALAVVVLLMIGLGRLVSGATRPALALFAGWGAAVFAMTLLGTLTPLSFRLLAAGLAAAGAVGLGRLLLIDADGAAWRRFGRILLLAAPLVLLAAGMRVSQWDELTHWLPNTRFLILHDGFPSAATPNPGSSWPAYPYALPLVGYLTGLVPGGLSDRVGILLNVVLLGAAASLIADLIADHRRAAAPPPTPSRLADWGLAAAALLFAVPLDPSFIPKLALSNYSDSATACALAATAIAALRWFQAALAGRPERTRLALACGAAATLLIGLRQANLVLVVLLFIGFAAAALGEERQAGRWLPSGLLVLPLPLVTAALWQRYSAAELPAGLFHFMPLEQWHFGLLGETARSMLRVVASKGGHFGLMAALLGLGILSLWRPALLEGKARLLCRSLVILFPGYTLFLLIAYIGAFSGYEASHAASFWRYSTHLGMLGVLAACAAALPLWRVRPGWTAPLSALAVALVLAAPVAAARYLRFDIAHPHDGYLTAVAREMRRTLPADARIDLVDAHHDGANLVLVRYQLLFGDRPGAALAPLAVAMIAGYPAERAAALPEPGSYVWLDEGGVEMRGAFGLDLPEPRASYLLRREAAGYRLLRTWPATPQTEIFAAADFP